MSKKSWDSYNKTFIALSPELLKLLNKIERKFVAMSHSYFNHFLFIMLVKWFKSASSFLCLHFKLFKLFQLEGYLFQLHVFKYGILLVSLL